MTRNNDSDADTGASVNRREYLKLGLSAAAATTVGVAASGRAAATLSRSSYRIRKGTNEETTVYVTEASTDGPTLMVTGGVHGDEKSGYHSAGEIKDWDIDAGKLVVISEACKPAIEAGTRGFADGDLNRHFPDGAEEESQLADAIWDVVVQEDIDFLWDLHSSYGIYESGDGGVGQALFATDAGDAGVHSKAIRDYLNAEVLDDSLDDVYDFREHTHHDDGSRDMLKHKVGATLDTPAIIFEATEKLSFDRRVKHTTAAVERFMYRFGLLETRSVIESTSDLRYDGDATAVNAPVDENGTRSGLTFGVTNEAGRELTITDIELSPANAAIDGLSDHSYDEGRWTSELHIDADVQAGLTDVNGGLSLPGSIDLSSDGHSDSADREAILSTGSTATVSLYQFESGGNPVDMVGEEVDVTLHYRLGDEMTGSASFTVSGGEVGYDGGAVAVNAPVDDHTKASGLQFDLTNRYDDEVRITNLSLAPANAAIDELSDHSYDEGRWTSELHIDSDVQVGLTDVNNGLALPGSIDLDADGHSDSADRDAVLSTGSTATVSLYQFESGGNPVDMVGETVDVTVDYGLPNGRTGSESFTVSPEGLGYDGDVTAVDASVDSNGKRSGVEFDLTNCHDRELTVTDLAIEPANVAIDELSDHSYDEGRWTSELHIDADVQAGLTDVNNGLALPGSIDLDADGHSDSASKNAVFSPGSSATVSLYQFESGGSPVDMVSETVAVTISYTLDDGRSGTRTVTLSP